MAKAPRLKDVDLTLSVKDKETYEDALKDLQKRMLKNQLRIFQEKKRAVIVMEGWDAAGKGGAIRRMTEKLDPRGVNVWPIGAPEPKEQGTHYLYRFFTKLPEPGDLTIYDRSWYGRVAVERVEGFAKKDEWQRAYREINEFERWLVDDGCPVVKLFVHVSQKEQLKRFREREKNPMKRWKIGPDDWRNRKKAPQYAKAYDEMFAKTHTRHAPWTIVEGEHKWWARLRTMRTVVEAIERFW